MSQPRAKPGPKPKGLIPQQGGQIVLDKAGPVKCGFCPSVFATRLNLQEHLKLHSDNRRLGTTKIMCPYCSISLQVYSLRGHVRNIHKMDPEAAGIFAYIESKIGKVPTNLIAQKSAANVNGMKPISKMKLFPCNLCNNSYKTQFSLKMHKKQFHIGGTLKNPSALPQSSSVCDRCNRQLKGSKQLTHHKTYCGSDRAFVCPYCSKQFEMVPALKKHMSHSHSNADLEPLTPTKVDTENRTILNANTGLMEEAQSEPDSGVDVKQPDIKKSTNQKTRCPVCTRKFMNEERLLEHKKYCGSVKAFKCSLCPEQYISIRSVTVHSKSRHNKVVLPCDFCNQKFSSTQELEVHRRVHKNLMKTKLHHKCRSCQNVYHGQPSFNNHKVHCREAFVHKCEKCFVRFQSENALTSHSPLCTGKSRLQEKLKMAMKTIKCLQCKNKFAGENDFINHFVESHVNVSNSIFSGVNPFDCTFCFYAANNQDSLKRHLAHCRGISFYVVKSSIQRQPAVQEGTYGQLNMSRTYESRATTISRKQNDVEVTEICSTAFMNEHLNASKNAQVVVEKLSDTMLNNVSGFKFGEPPSTFVSVKMEPESKPSQSPGDKMKCEFCKKFFTHAGFPSHRCPKRKKLMAKNVREQQKQKVTESKPLIKCELCYDIVVQDTLQEHLRAVHKAIKPAEMARSMIELTSIKHVLSVPNIKLEKNDEGEDASGQSDEEDEATEATEGNYEAEEAENESAEADIEAEEVDNEDIEADIEAEDVEIENEDEDEDAEADIEAEEVENDAAKDLEAQDEELEVDVEAEEPENEAQVNGDVAESILPEADEETSEPTNDVQEESVTIRCDICGSVFTLADLEVHLKEVHHAVNPVAMARTMMENSLDFSKLSINVKTDHGSDSEDEDEDSLSPGNSPDSEEKSPTDGGHNEESQSPEPPSLETRILESIETRNLESTINGVDSSLQSRNPNNSSTVLETR